MLSRILALGLLAAGCAADAGADGSSCTVEETENGAMITCDDGTKAALSNGSDGIDGIDGTEGMLLSEAAPGQIPEPPPAQEPEPDPAQEPEPTPAVDPEPELVVPDETICIILPGLYRWTTEPGACGVAGGVRLFERSGLAPILEGITGTYLGLDAWHCDIPIDSYPGMLAGETLVGGKLTFDLDGNGSSTVDVQGPVACPLRRDTITVVPL